MKIIADDKIPYLRGVLEPFARVEYLPGRDITASAVADADVLLVRTRTRCDRALLEGSSVRLVATATIGTDHIDGEWCAGAGIEVVSAPGCNAGGVLQWVSAALAGVLAADSRRPEDTVLGVVGVGHVGSLVVRCARDWGFRVVCSDPPREDAGEMGPADGAVPFAELAAVADVVTFHVPLTGAGAYPTLGLAGRRFFDTLKPGAAVFNASRGGVVDEAAWLESLAAGRCRACVDTWCGEPNIDLRLLDEAMYATPHIAGYSVQGKANATAAVVAAVTRRYGLPLAGWYPAGVQRVDRRAIGWGEMIAGMSLRFDIAAQTAALKRAPGDFERMREEYSFRQEFF